MLNEFFSKAEQFVLRLALLIILILGLATVVGHEYRLVLEMFQPSSTRGVVATTPGARVGGLEH